jgi:hypothetical protein
LWLAQIISPTPGEQDPIRASNGSMAYATLDVETWQECCVQSPCLPRYARLA